MNTLRAVLPTLIVAAVTHTNAQTATATSPANTLPPAFQQMQLEVTPYVWGLQLNNIGYRYLYEKNVIAPTAVLRAKVQGPILFFTFHL